MNRKGQMEMGIGTILMTAVAIIVALSIFTGGITSPVGTMTNTATSTANIQVLDADLPLTGQAVSGVTVINATGGETVPATNYTINNYKIGSDGVLRAYLSNTTSGYAGRNVNVSYTYEPLGYDTSAGGRVVTSLILIFAALAIAVVAIVPVLRNGVIDMIS